MVAATARSRNPGTRHRSRSAAILAGSALTLAACSGGDGGGATITLSQDDPDLTPSVDDVGATGPTGTVQGLRFATFEGGTRSLDEFVGRPLVINFFAAWCGPCVAEMPDLEEVYQEVKSEVAFLGLAQDQVADDALGLIERTGVSYETGWDPALDVYLEFGGFSMPTTVFVTSEGEVIEVFPGALTADAIREKVAGIRS
jgi:thiol-disulfide isomerase/thioredoxin